MWLSIVGSVLALLTTIAQGIGSLVSWMRESSLKKQATIEAENKQLKDEIAILKKVQEAREEADTVIRSTPESDSLPDDGFRRD